MKTLADYIAAEIEKPFSLGTNDCAHFVSGWVENMTGHDGLAIFDGLPEQAAKEVIQTDKYLVTIARAARSIGLKRTDNPQIGDIAALRLPNRLQAAILGQSGWVYRNEQGINMNKNARLIAAWRVE